MGILCARSVEENAKWYSEQAQGCWLRPLEQLVGRLRDTDGLESIGFLSDLSREGLRQDEVDEEHPLIAEQNCRAGTVGRLVCALLFREIWSALWFLGPPGIFAGLRSAEHRGNIMKRLHKIHDLLKKKVPEWKGTLWKSMQERSVLNDVYVQKVCLVCRYCDPMSTRMICPYVLRNTPAQPALFWGEGAGDKFGDVPFGLCIVDTFAKSPFLCPFFNSCNSCFSCLVICGAPPLVAPLPPT